MLMTNFRFGVSARTTLLVMFVGAVALHAQPAPAVILPPTVEGDWVRTDENHSGSFDGLTSTYKQAELTAEGKALLARFPLRQQQQPSANDPPHKPGEPYVTNARTCVFNQGQLGLEYDSEGFHAIVNKEHVTFVQERGWQRLVYLDGRKLPDSSVRTPTNSGYSIGHVEPNGTLVVETNDLAPGRVTAGGVRSPETIARQEYIPAPDGKSLKILFTWIDPKLYATPHRYEYTFERMEPGAYALETFCDPTDPLWGQTIVPPPQR